jgi:copper chaperone CopZ
MLYLATTSGNTRTTTVRVEDMTRGYCPAIIIQAVKNIDPKATVTVDIRSKTVSIASQLDPNRLVVAIRVAGYKPHIVEN